MERLVIDIGGTGIPVLCAGPEQPAAVVILVHGLGASKEAQIPEIERLAAAGFLGVVMDAPHHGERADGLLDLFPRLGPVEVHDLVLTLVEETSREVAGLIDALRCQWHVPVGVGGISMGGHVAFAAPLREPKPAFCIPIIGSPDWYAYSQRAGKADFACPRRSPCEFPERFLGIPLLAISAGRDQVVCPEPTRAFIADLNRKHPDGAALRTLREYPLSEHFMRATDWDDAWRAIVEWLSIRFRTR